MTGEQKGMDLTAVPALGREDFIVSPANATAVASIEAWAGWPSGKLVLVGPKASGKSHLAGVWAGMTGARVVAAADLAQADIAALAQGPVVVEDAAGRAGDGPAERALFRLHNLVLSNGHPLLITADAPPARWPLALPDLASRMQATATAELHPPDDDLLGAVLVKLLSDRQVPIAPDVVRYAVERMDRRFAAVTALARALNTWSFHRKGGLTKPLVREVLDKLRGDG